MSTSSPVRTRQPHRPSLPSQAASSPPRGDAAFIVGRSILLVVAAISVIATSNYFAYLIGRKQVAYEELRKQVDRVVQLIDRKQGEDGLAATTLKQRQERLEQNVSSLTGLTTSTINGRTTATPEPAPDGRPVAAVLTDDMAAAPEPEARVPPAELNAATKQRVRQGSAHKRGAHRQKAASALVSPQQGQMGPAIAGQSGQVTNALPVPSPDAGAASQ